MNSENQNLHTMSSFTEAGDDSVYVTGSSVPSGDHAYGSYGSGVAHHGLDNDSDSVADSPFFNDDSSYRNGGDVFASRQASEVTYSPPIYASDGGYVPEVNGEEFDEEDGPILPVMEEMESEQGFALREWRRQNAIQLEEKERQEKELLSQIIDEADEYKVEFYRKRAISCETNKTMNREKEKFFVANLEKLYAEADKDYWKSIAELVPNEMATLEKRRGKKDQEKKPSVVVVHGPKPGKPTDLSRLRQILLKLKHNAPEHLKHSPPQPAASPEDAKPGCSVDAPAAVVAQPKEVLAAA